MRAWEPGWPRGLSPQVLLVPLEPSAGKESTWGALTQTGRPTLAISKARVYQSGLPLLQMTEHSLERASAEKKRIGRF